MSAILLKVSIINLASMSSTSVFPCFFTLKVLRLGAFYDALPTGLAIANNVSEHRTVPSLLVPK